VLAPSLRLRPLNNAPALAVRRAVILMPPSARRAACPLLAVALLGGVLAAGAATAGFEGAKWIWYSREPMPNSINFPAGVNFFRATFTLPPGVPITGAQLILTADNLYSFHLNGKLAGEGFPDQNAWGRPKRFEVGPLLVPGRNVLAIEAVNTLPGPAGLIARLSVRLANGESVTLVTDENWRCTDNEVAGWIEPGFDDQRWQVAHVVGGFGMAPWGQIAAPPTAQPAGGPLDDARQQVRAALEDLKEQARHGGVAGPRAIPEVQAPADFAWPEAVAFLSDDCSLYRPPAQSGTSYDSLTVTTFNPHHTSAFPEHDLPAPVKVARKLLLLKPARPGVTPSVLLDAGKGGVGSPSASFDGRWIYFSMAREGEAFFHLWRLPAEGGEPQQLTTGPFHDIDPVELPDGRIAFTSTRIGTFEEYHNPPSRSLFTMKADGGELRPLTHTFIFDNEPEVLPDGRILFLRSDNFFDRGKVETMLHAIHPDGTEGYTEFGLDLGPEYGNRLRAFNVGSPAPLPDGRVAFVTGSTLALGWPGTDARDWRHLRIEASDVAALPDGKLLCTLPRRASTGGAAARPLKRTTGDFDYTKLAIVDPDQRREQAILVFESQGETIHSPVFLGARSKPPQLVHKVPPPKADDLRATGVLYCQNARLTRNTSAGWPHVRAIRVLAGKGLTTRSSHSYIVHAGSEVTELGTVPLAPDGSFAVEVPADTAIAFQAVDAEGRSELNEMSWNYVRPGETRGCVGCHQPRQAAPAEGRGVTIQAMRAKPLKLTGEGRPHRFRGNNAAVTGLMELQFDRYREVAGINRHSDTADLLATGPQEILALISQLKSDPTPLRHTAAQRLGLARDLAAAPALATALQDTNREVRVAAAVALAACGTRDSVPPLLAALVDADPLVAQAAAMALENLTGQALPFDAFVESAQRAAQVRQCREWLRQNPWDAIEAALVKRLGSANRDDVRRAAVALGHVGGDAARAALRRHLTQAREANPYPAWRRDGSHRGDGAMFNSLAAVNPRPLQAATRALGYLRDTAGVPMLADTIARFSEPETGNLFLVEAAVEALGRIGTPEAESALTTALARLKEYPEFTRWYGDHDALIACHASPVHYIITEALDRLGSTNVTAVVPALIRSVPTDPDRALLLGNDDCEALVGRVIRRTGMERTVVETCLAVLGEASAARDKSIEAALAATHQAWGGKPDLENRAAQILSLVCRDPHFEPAIRAALLRFQSRPVDIPRVFDTGIPVVNRLPAKNWVCFFLARSLGNLRAPQSVETLVAVLKDSPTEAASGRPDPLGPGVLFLHNDLTPCWRAAVAWALGEIGDPRATPVLLQVLADLDNAPDTRHATARALGQIAEAASLPAAQKLAADYPEVSVRRALREACVAMEARARAAAQPAK
jgi:HEAT repeat protein